MVVAPDPWLPSRTAANSSNGPNTSTFEDNFVNPGALPDSAEYLACLERKLQRIQKGRGQSSKNLLKSLEERRQDCIARLLAEDLSPTPSHVEVFSDQDVPTKWLKSYLNPEQALTVGELVELVKADYLAKEVEKNEEAADSTEDVVQEEESSQGEKPSDSTTFVHEDVKGKNMNKIQRSREMSKITGVKALCLITGGSQGIGQGIAFELAKILAPNSKLLLLARSLSNLNATARKIEEINPKIVTVCMECDLTSTHMIESISALLKTHSELDSYDSHFLIHNAGSEGMGSLAKDMDSVDYWQRYMCLNMYSMTAITSFFLRTFDSGAPRTIVNITSLAAVAPFKGMGFYCVSKSSREMYLRVLAEENPDVHILNYSPGVVKTDMISRVINTVKDKNTKQSFESMVNDDKLLEPSETIGYMIEVLDKGTFKNGGRVDFYDRDIMNGVAK